MIQRLHALDDQEITSFWPCFLLICILVCVCQIAPAENPNVTERMVIITGTPEAQFKVKTLWICVSVSSKIRLFHAESCNLFKIHVYNFNPDHFILLCMIVNSSGSLCVPIFPSLSSPHSLLFIPGPRSDIWEAERGELLHSERGGQTGDAHQGSLDCSWQGHRQRRQDGELMPKLKWITV